MAQQETKIIEHPSLNGIAVEIRECQGKTGPFYSYKFVRIMGDKRFYDLTATQMRGALELFFFHELTVRPPKDPAPQVTPRESSYPTSVSQLAAQVFGGPVFESTKPEGTTPDQVPFEDDNIPF